MRLIVVLLFFGVVTYVNAASCPAGYVLVDVPDVSVADTCPSGTVAVGSAEACTDSDPASVCWIVEKILINDKIKQRREQLESEAMHFFEILTLSLETGRNLEEALNVTINSIDCELSLEFKEAIRETNFGKSLKEIRIYK